MAVKGHEKLVQALEATLSRASAELDELRAADTAREDERLLTVRDLAERFNLSEDVVIEFAKTAGALLGHGEMSVQTARRAALVAISDQVWEGALGPLLPGANVRELIGDVSRQRVDELLRNRRLIGLRESGGRRVYPAFQFHDGRPLETLIAAFWTLVDAPVDEWTAASWCVAPDDALDGRSPAAFARLSDAAERLADVARQDAARLAQ
jgi:hypothetical protein